MSNEFEQPDDQQPIGIRNPHSGNAPEDMRELPVTEVPGNIDPTDPNLTPPVDVSGIAERDNIINSLRQEKEAREQAEAARHTRNKRLGIGVGAVVSAGAVGAIAALVLSGGSNSAEQPGQAQETGNDTQAGNTIPASQQVDKSGIDHEKGTVQIVAPAKTSENTVPANQSEQTKEAPIDLLAKYKIDPEAAEKEPEKYFYNLAAELGMEQIPVSDKEIDQISELTRNGDFAGVGAIMTKALGENLSIYTNTLIANKNLDLSKEEQHYLDEGLLRYTFYSNTIKGNPTIKAIKNFVVSASGDKTYRVVLGFVADAAPDAHDLGIEFYPIDPKTGDVSDKADQKTKVVYPEGNPFVKIAGDAPNGGAYVELG